MYSDTGIQKKVATKISHDAPDNHFDFVQPESKQISFEPATSKQAGPAQ